jgi:hypothetical protein
MSPPVHFFNMQKILLRFVVALAAFLLGIAAVFAASKFWIASERYAFVFGPVYEIQVDTPRFMRTSRGCGKGFYIQSYVTEDRQSVAEGVVRALSPQESQLEFYKRVNDAKQLVELLPEFRDYRGETGERIILVNRPDEEGGESVSILFYNGGDSYKFLNAPTLELAIEFERYLMHEDLKSPF